MDKVKVLIVGAGSVGEEKLTFLLKSSPNANVTIVSKTIDPSTSDLIKKYPKANLDLKLKGIEQKDIEDHDIIVAATNHKQTNHTIYKWAKENRKIVNVADTPDLCDFYMGSIVTKGNIKIAISTNGKSPTFAKRMRQFLENILSDETANLVENLNQLKSRYSDDFKTRVAQLNKVTEGLIKKNVE